MAGSKKTPETMSYDDARAFVDVYLLLTEESPPLPPGERRTLRAVIEAGCKRGRFSVEYPAVLARLTKVFDHVWPGRPSWKGSGLDELFHEADPGRGIEPTRKARVVFSHLKNVVVVYDRFLPSVKNDLRPKEGPRTIRVGCPHSIGLRVLSAVFTGWRRVFRNRLNLELEVANSGDVIRQLNAAVLDLVVSYGPLKTDVFRREGEGPIRYEPLRYHPFNQKFESDRSAYVSQLVLISHPDLALRLRDGSDANEIYRHRSSRHPTTSKGGRQSRVGESRPFDELEPIPLNTVDLTANRFIRVETWEPPGQIEQFYDTLIRLNPPRLVQWHEEALALVRASLGHAIVSEGTAHRRGITAFRLTPEEDFSRAIGVYRREGEPLSEEAELLVALMRRFLSQFASFIREIKAPRYGNQELEDFYLQFCRLHGLPAP